MSIAEHFADLEWTEATVQVEIKGQGKTTWPRYIGTSPDGKTALELIGGSDNIRSVTLLGEMSVADMEATRRNGAYAAVVLAIVCPNWGGRDKWLAHEMKQLRITKQVSIRQSGWHIGLRFEGATLTLKAVK